MDQRPHYVRSVTEMGERQSIVAHEDIYASNGMKLLARGASVDRSYIDLLCRHKLRAPLDLALSAENQVDSTQLAFEANKLLASDSVMATLAERSGDPLGFRQCLGALPLPAPIMFRLTVMREMRSALFDHSLRIALITYALAVRMNVPRRDLNDLLIAALCHDLGEMHTDPELLAPGHSITLQERRFIHVHPVTGYVLLCDVPSISNATLQAVLQHHERLDGSGYPAGLSGGRIHAFARILCVAEVTEGLVRRGDPRRVDVLLRLNHQRFDTEVTHTLRELLLIGQPSPDIRPPALDPTAQLARFERLFADSPGLIERLEGRPDGAQELAFVRERIAMLRALVHNSGMSPEYHDALVDVIREDPEVASEFAATMDELKWLMLDIANEIERRAALVALVDDEAAGVAAELLALLRGTGA
ncbi:HD-GYP domain-containing protein [Thauera sinica]|uniref:HD-GYP domain-containing protein n=1 Tax=Thauera sinica TaxID=2665146 RepID=A0ABW1ALL8_9RHOO|nr:HD domain-containing phosphohydrolase [Thauera sp. K11]